MQKRINAILIAITIAIIVLVARSSAHAATVSWNDGAAKWESNSWTGGVGSAPPTSGDAAVIGNDGVVGYDATTGTNTVLSLQVGSDISPKGAGTLNISGGSLTVTNNVTIAAPSSRDGTLNITGGTLTVGGIIGDGGTGISTLTLNGGTLDLTNGSITVNVFNLQSGTLSNLSDFNSGSALVKSTAGTLTLSGTNTFTGGVTLNGGAIGLGVNSVGAPGSLTSGPLGTGTLTVGSPGPVSLFASGGARVVGNAITFTGTTLAITGANNLELSGAVSLGAAARTFQIDNSGLTTLSGVVSGGVGGGITKTGAGTLALTASNTYSSTTTISAGTLQLGNGGTTGTLATTSGIADNANFTINRSNAVAQGTDFTGSAIAGTGSVTQAGGGTTTLNAANTYTGATTVNAGTLRLDSAGSTTPRLVGTSGITVNSGGTLLMANSSGTTSNDRIGNAATMTLAGGTFNTGGLSERGGTVLAPTAGIGALTLTATSTIDFGAGTTSMIEFAGVGTHTLGTVLQIINWDGIAGTGGGTEALLFAGTTTAFTSIYNQADVSFNGIAGYDAVQFTGFYEITKVPEPGTWIGGSLALAALAFSQRRRILSKLNSRLAVSR
jgi:autotransporter-associated beta strand protein